MPTYTRSNTLFADNPGFWKDVAAWTFLSINSGVIRLTNSDNTITEVTGTGLTLDGGNNASGGTVTSVRRFAANGTTLLETVTGLSISFLLFQTSIATDIGTALSGSDTINGSAASEVLFGGGGSDTFNPGAATLDIYARGGDVMVGGAGNDTFNVGSGNAFDYTVSYALESGGNGVVVNLGTNTATDTFGNTDTLTGIVSVNGTNFADNLTGDDTTNDFFQPGGGNDTIDGKGGFDSLEYGVAAFFNLNAFGFPAVGITVNQSGDNAGTVTDPLGGTDTFTNIERIRGTNYVDTFNGSAFDDSFRGYGGADVFNGGQGFDEVDYRGDASRGGLGGVNVNLAGGTAIDGFGTTDALNSIEQVFGTQFADTILGGSGGEFLGGDAGADTINGGDGDDSIRGGAGNDTINGGNGNDRADYRSEGAGSGGINVSMTGGGAGTVIDAFGNTDTLISIEIVAATDFNDTLTGSAGDDDFRPGRGNDTLDAGSDGFDIVNYLIDDAATSGVVVNFATNQVTSAFYGTDTLIGIWNQVFGTQNNDQLIGRNGNATDEWFDPSLGVDTVDGGTNTGSGRDILSMNDFRVARTGNGVVFNVTAAGGGTAFGTGINVTFSNIELLNGTTFADTFNGGASSMTFRGLGGVDVFNGAVNGFETVDYSGDASNGGLGGATVNLASGTSTDGFGNAETLLNIDGAIGTAVADNFTGNSGNNFFSAGAGADVISAGNGNDTLSGGSGTNTLGGGGGRDRATYSIASSAATIVRNLNGTVTISGSGFADTLSNVEVAVFTDKTVALREVARGDFNGEGTSDLVLQSGGTVVDWIMQNGAYQTGNVLTTGASGYTVVGKGDFNGDGTADLALQSGGVVVDWIMQNGAYQAGNVITTGATGYNVVAAGDLNGDGTTDLVLQSGGVVVDWIMQNGLYQSGGVLTTGAAGYTVVGSGDVNGDGTSDLVLQNGGVVVDWIMQNGAYQSGNVITTGATGYTVKGVGDLDGDGDADLVLQSGGVVVDWIMQNGAYQAGNVITTGAAGYDVVGVGDYNGDGTADIALQNGGVVVNWIMQNGLFQSGNVITTGATGFTVV